MRHATVRKRTAFGKNGFGGWKYTIKAAKSCGYHGAYSCLYPSQHARWRVQSTVLGCLRLYLASSINGPHACKKYMGPSRRINYNSWEDNFPPFHPTLSTQARAGAKKCPALEGARSPMGQNGKKRPQNTSQCGALGFEPRAHIERALRPHLSP